MKSNTHPRSGLISVTTICGAHAPLAFYFSSTAIAYVTRMTDAIADVGGHA